jgi:putative DNA primase/helicase
MMDTLSILTHSRNLTTKLWKANGTIDAFGDAKFYKLTEHKVGNIAELSALLTKLQAMPRAVLIRGKYVGAELAQQRDPEFQPGDVRRMLDYFNDQPLHTVLIDVDGFVPVMVDPITDPEEAVLEFVQTMLPMEWAGASYHWQLSSSFGHPTKVQDGLKVHIWFWLEKPLTSAQLKAWAKSVDLPADMALFNPVQCHYTAAPMFEAGVDDPIAVRSGFVQGYLSDTVDFEVDEAALAAVQRSGGSGKVLADLAETDPVAVALNEKGMIKSRTRDGFNIVCPFADEHSSESVESATQYRLPHTNGHAMGQFMCLHAHCKGRGRGQFLARLGVDEVSDEFTVVETSSEPTQSAPDAVKPLRKGFAKAQYLTTDLANANRIVERFGKHMIVVAGQWHGWDGRRWCKDDGEVYKRASDLSKLIRAEADGWRAKKTDSAEEKKKNEAIADALGKWANKSEMKSVFDAGMGMVKKMHSVDESRIDANPWLLNCLNGTVDLRTGALKPHDSDDLITKLCPVVYDQNAKAPVWEDTLAKVTLEERTPTRPLAMFLQRWFGYCATGSVREQQFLVHYGNGSNGKSTIIETIAAVLGDYAGVTAPGLLMTKGHESHPTEIADLFGRRMVTAHETGEGGMLREDFVKQATGGDKMKARYMRADFFEFSPTHKLQLLTNYKPQIKGQDTGIWRRVLLMPYMARFASQEDIAAGRGHHVKDTKIADKLAAEQQGVLAWLVRGARQWFLDGLQPPDAVLAASRDYQVEQDRVGQFVAECCELGPEMQDCLADGMGGVYEAYRTWCGEGGMHALSKGKFVQELERVVPGFKSVESRQKGTRKKVRVLHGLKVISEA